MALTLRKAFLGKNSTLKTKNSIIEDLVNESIKSKLFNLLNIDRMIYFRLIEYFLVYGITKDSKEKTIASIYIRLKNRKYESYLKVSVKEIESMGVNLIEFIDYLILNGASEIKNNYKLLEAI